MSLKGKTCLIAYNPSLDHPKEDFDSNVEKREDIKAVKNALRELGVRTTTLGLRRISPGLVSHLKKEIRPDFVFNLCETFRGRNHAEMHVASFYELLGLPYTGSTPLALGLAVNKMRCKKILQSFNLPVTEGVSVPVGGRFELPANRRGRTMKFPFIVKPALEDGSFGLTKNSVVYDIASAQKQVTLIHQNFNQSALVEEYIDGREVTVVIIHQPPFYFGLSEVIFRDFSENELKFISYEVKWAAKTRLSFVFPAPVAPALRQKLEKISAQAFQLMGCRDYARVDIRIDKNGRPYILEVNPNPDISPKSEFENLARTSGLTYTDFIRIVSENALQRRADTGLEL